MLSSMFEESYVPVPRSAEFVLTPEEAFQNRSATDGYGAFYSVYSQLALNATAMPWTTEDYYFLPFELRDRLAPSNSSDRYQATTVGIGADLVCEEMSFDVNGNAIEGARTGGLPNTTSGSGSGGAPDWDLSLNVVGSSVDGSVEIGDLLPIGGVCLSAIGWVDPNVSVDYTQSQPQFAATLVWPDWSIMKDYSEWGDSTDECSSVFPIATINVGLSGDLNDNPTVESFQKESQLCTSFMRYGLFNVTVTPTGTVQEAVLANQLAKVPDSDRNTKWRENINYKMQLANSFYPDSYSASGGSNSARYLERRLFESYASTNWALILAGLNASSQLDASKWPAEFIPSASDLTQEIRSIYRRLFVEYVSLDANSSVPIMTSLQPNEPAADGSIPIAGQNMIVTRRVLVSRPRFIISAIILGIFLLTLAAVYTRRLDRGLPFVPTSLGATLALVYFSEALEDVRGTSGINTEEREQRLRALGYRYYIGWGDNGDGRRRYGLHRESGIRTEKGVCTEEEQHEDLADGRVEGQDVDWVPRSARARALLPRSIMTNVQ